MPKLSSTRITLREARDAVLADWPDTSSREVEEWIEHEWQHGALKFYDREGNEVRPNKERKLEPDFETSEVRAPRQAPVNTGDEQTPRLLEGTVVIAFQIADGRIVWVDRRELHTLLEAAKSRAEPSKTKPARPGRPPKGDKMLEAFIDLRDAEVLEKSMTKKVIHNLVLEKLFKSWKIPVGYSYHSFIRHVGKGVDAWLVE